MSLLANNERFVGVTDRELMIYGFVKWKVSE